MAACQTDSLHFGRLIDRSQLYLPVPSGRLHQEQCDAKVMQHIHIGSSHGLMSVVPEAHVTSDQIAAMWCNDACLLLMLCSAALISSNRCVMIPWGSGSYPLSSIRLTRFWMQAAANVIWYCIVPALTPGQC